MIKLIFTIVFLITGNCVFAQQADCKVKMPEISGYYSGECKKGFANGKGTARGIDLYEGEFSKGLPEGHGVYKYANGSYYDGEWKAGMRNGQGKFVTGDSVISGFWKANHYEGKTPAALFKITVSRNVQREAIIKSTESNNGVKIKLLLGGRENTEIEDFSLAYTSGSEYKNVGTYGIQNANVPFDVTIRYRTWNQLHTAQYEVLFEFTILQPGTFNVTLTNM